jgi:hypothetical protein
MAFNLKPSDGDGEFVPYVKYNAKAGRWFFRNEGHVEELEIVAPTFHIDMAHIETGWIFYASGQAPIRVADPGPGQMAEKPAGGLAYKRGFWVKVWSSQTGVREFSSCAAAVIGPICEMYNLFEAQSAAHPGQVMVCQCVRVAPVKGKKDTNYAPVFELKGWQACPHFNHAGPVNQQRPAAQQPAQPRAEASADDPGSRAWQKFLAQKRTENVPQDQITAAWKRAFEDYFGTTYNPRFPNAAQWEAFVKDDFRVLPELAPAGSAVPEDQIPF